MEPPEDTDPTLFYFAMSFLTWLYWVAFSMLGGLLGGLITFDITGIDFALTALFVVLFIEQVIKKENRAPGAAGLVCAVAGLAVFGAGQHGHPGHGADPGGPAAGKEEAMRLDTIHSLIIVAMVALATQITRWTPFLLFSGDKKLPKVVEDLGRLLPPGHDGPAGGV